jgi:hypothetical protein
MTGRPTTCITKHYTHKFFVYKFVKENVNVMTPNTPQYVNKKHMPKTDHDIP